MAETVEPTVEYSASEVSQPTSQFGLLKTRRLLPLFITQFFGAFNDSVYKQALLLIFVFSAVAEAHDTDLLNNVAAALFILPFFLFSATAGALADSFDKALLIRRVKLIEIGVAVLIAISLFTQNVIAMLVVLFLLGTQSTFFGPLKYALLPQQLHRDELVGGNAMVAMGTFVAILLGTVGGGILGNQDIVGAVSSWLSFVVIVTAILGFLACLKIAPAPPEPSSKPNWNPVSETINLIRLAARKKAVFRSVLGVSWFWLVGSVLLTQIPNLTKEHLYGDGTVVTGLLALFTVAIAIGSLACEKLGGRKIEVGVVPIGAAGLSLFGIDSYFAIENLEPVALRGIWEFIAADGTLRLLIDLMLMGMFAGVFVIPMQALIQNRTPQGEIARVIAANNILNSLAMVLGAGLSILWLTVLDFDIPSLVLIIGIFTAVVATYIFITVPEFVMRLLVWAIGHSIYRIRTTGLDNVPDKGPAILVANHVSFVDFMLLAGVVHRPLRFVMAREYFDMKVVNWVARVAGVVPITRKDEDPETYESAFEQIREGLNIGEVYCIFPEGRLTRDGEINPFQHGIERILRASPVPVVPVSLGGMWGSFFSRAEGAKKLSKRVRIKIGEAVQPEIATAELLQDRVTALRGDDR